MPKNLISIQDLTKDEILHILDVAREFEANREQDFLAGKVVACLFFEPSTRTRLSFESAVNRLRPPGAGAAATAASVASVPVVNAGDGANQHPTQTLLDLYAIRKTQGRLEGLDIDMVGDLKYGRAVHSLVEALRYFSPRFTFTSPEELDMPKKYLDMLDRDGVPYTRTGRIEDGLDSCDILYMTRVQQERFPDKEEYDKVKDVYRLTASMLGGVRPNMKIMHPLPRVNEIATDVDSTPYAYYFQQAGGGMYVRMAIIACLLGYR